MFPDSTCTMNFLHFVLKYFYNSKFLFQGTTYVYSTFLRPIVAKHEQEIDQHLNEWKTRACDIVFHYWQRGSIYAQSRFVDVMYVLR